MQRVFSLLALVAAAVTFALPVLGSPGAGTAAYTAHVCPPGC
jgi:hypothetical protein